MGISEGRGGLGGWRPDLLAPPWRDAVPPSQLGRGMAEQPIRGLTAPDGRWDISVVVCLFVVSL